MKIEKSLKINESEFSMLFELEDIISIEQVGLKNCIDISVEGNHTFLLKDGLVSHNSASGSLIPSLGNDEFGYYELKGKPLNAYDRPQKDFQKNIELTELYNIIKTEGYEYYIFATDQDLDGFTIRGLLLGFFFKYANEELANGKIGVLNTPIRANIKNNKLINWVYNLNDILPDKPGSYSKYFKGIGTWKPEWFEQVIRKDGINKMISIWEYDSNAPELIDAWLNGDRVQDRKEKLRNNNFDLIKL